VLVKQMSCEGMQCDCDGCLWEDAAPVDRPRTRNGRTVRREACRYTQDQAAKSLGQSRKGEEQ
jgi:hypothetical protein